MTGESHTLLLDLNDLEVLPDGNEADERSDESEDDGPEGVFCHRLENANRPRNGVGFDNSSLRS